MNKPIIVNIPEKMEKYYGKGTMLHPSKSEIEALISLVPYKKVTTINNIASHLATVHGTDVTCPMRVGNAIKKISEQYTLATVNEELPFWRVIRSNNLMIKTKQYEDWAALLEEEGFELSFMKSGNIKVAFKEEDVVDFDG